MVLALLGLCGVACSSEKQELITAIRLLNTLSISGGGVAATAIESGLAPQGLSYKRRRQHFWR